MATATKSQVIHLYRELHRHVRLLSPSKRQESLLQLRSGFKDNKNESAPEKIQELIKQGESKLGYLKIIVPRRGRIFGTTGKFVMKDGELVPGKSKKESQFYQDKRLDPADYERHMRLLKRQHYIDRHLPLRNEDAFEKPKIVPVTFKDD